MAVNYSDYKDRATRKKYSILSSDKYFQFLDGYVEEESFSVSEDLAKKLSKELGISYETYLSVSLEDRELAKKIVLTMSKRLPEIRVLVDLQEGVAINYSLDMQRTSLLNESFLHRVCSLLEAESTLEISEIYYSALDTVSHVLVNRKDPIIIEEKYENKPSVFNEYNIGILLINDENSIVSTRLVCNLAEQPVYLPASLYNATSGRFYRSAHSPEEALELLTLKVIEDLRDDNLYDKVYNLHHRYRYAKNIVTTYEEYTSLLRTMKKIPSIIEDPSFLEALESRYLEYERKYAHLDEQKSSYIWRCTALSEVPIGTLISLTSHILHELNAPPIEYFHVRELLGSYMSTSRIVEEIAKESIE